MKQVTPNLTDVLTTKYIANLSRLRKFARYWGTTTIDGVEVFSAKKHYYPNMDASTEQLAKMLGVYNDIKVKPEGIRSAWFQLSAEKATDSHVSWDKNVLTANFNRAFTKVLECSVTIGARLNNKQQIPANITTPITDQVGIFNEIKTKYLSLWNSGHVFFTSEDDPYLYLLVSYILRSDDIPYEVLGVEQTVSTTYRPTVNGMGGIRKTDQVPAWRVRLLIPHMVLSTTTDIINLLVADGAAARPNAMALVIRERIRAAVALASPEDGDDEDKPDVTYRSLPVTTGSFWHTAATSEGDYTITRKYLKTSILTTNSLNTAEKLSYILSCVDTGYRKKKRKWYETLAVIFIVVLAVWAAGPTGAKAAALLGGGTATSAVVIAAVTLTVASMYISLAAVAAGLMGAQNIASSLAQFLKAVSPLTRIASVVSVLASVYGVIKQGLEKIALGAAKEGLKATLGSVLKGIASTALENIMGLTKLSNMTMAHVTKMLSFTFDIYKDLANRDLQREINNYRREIAAISESEEKVQTSDVVKELMYSYPNPLSNDWSYYAELYDRPYEWWATPYHTGNIQATTVNALWLNDPQNAILYNNSTGDS